MDYLETLKTIKTIIMKKKLLKYLAILTFIMCSMNLSAQDVDLVASVDVTPPLTVGQTFTYTIQAIAGTTDYVGLQVDLEYNTSVIQLNSFTPDNSVLTVIGTPTAADGEIIYSAGTFPASTSGTTTIFTAVFEVVSTSESVMIEHQLYSDGINDDGTVVINGAIEEVTGITNDIILATLSVEQSEFSNGISVFPNPVNDVLNIQLNGSHSEIDNIKIFSIDGKLIQQYNSINLNNNLIKLDTSKLKQAMYFVTITSKENELATFKMIVN